VPAGVGIETHDPGVKRFDAPDGSAAYSSQEWVFRNAFCSRARGCTSCQRERSTADDLDSRNVNGNPHATAHFRQLYILDADRHVGEINAEKLN
jgi:hypothetical protein